MTTVSQEAVEVTQADREAAADLYLALDGGSVDPSDIAYADAVRQGRCDDCAAVQAFARHRQSAERGEVVAWLYTHGEVKVPLLDRTPDMVDRGWTETPLYTLPTAPEAVRTPIEGTSHAD